jgi:hypothetical protein
VPGARVQGLHGRKECAVVVIVVESFEGEAVLDEVEVRLAEDGVGWDILVLGLWDGREGDGIWFAERVDGSQKSLRVLWLIDEDMLYDGGAYLCIHDLVHCEIRFRGS